MRIIMLTIDDNPCLHVANQVATWLLDIVPSQHSVNTLNSRPTKTFSHLRPFSELEDSA